MLWGFWVFCITCVINTVFWLALAAKENHETLGETFSAFGSQQHKGKSAILQKILNNPNFGLNAPDCEGDGQQIQCDPESPYRTFNGSCNNLEHPTWGMLSDCLLRVLPAAYEGKSGIRNSVRGGPLPEPRHLSLNIFTNLNRPTPRVNFWFTVFGQGVAHDQSESTPPIGPGLIWGAGIDCCPPAASNNPACLPITLPPDDPFYSKRNMTCLNFLRGVECSRCENEEKRQIATFVTAAIDAHLVYGLSKEESDSLRTNDGTGRLEVQDTDEAQNLLPANHEKFFAFCPPKFYKDCFRSGDIRVNQHTFLSSVHLLFTREHNRIASELKRINPHWDGDKIFLTARKIVGAEMQVIVYKEYLPLLLGERYMSMFDLHVKEGAKGTEYDPSLRFGVWVEYTSATFRAHSMIPKDTGYEEFRFMYSNPYPLRDGNVSRVIQGSCRRPSQKYDHWNVEDVTNYLYRQPGDDFGLDLVSVDILRGRDHGMPTYVDVLNYCSATNKPVTSFDQLSAVMTAKNVQLLKQNYKDIRDVDLYVGMQMENIMEGSVLPPTSACIIAGQFYFMKYGDRFYFEHMNESGSFTRAQRKSLKKFNINRLICANTDLKHLQKNAFETSEKTVPCHSTRKNDVDLRLWKSNS